MREIAPKFPRYPLNKFLSFSLSPHFHCQNRETEPVLIFEMHFSPFQARNTATGAWRANTVTAITASASTGSAQPATESATRTQKAEFQGQTKGDK